MSTANCSVNPVSGDHPQLNTSPQCSVEVSQKVTVAMLTCLTPASITKWLENLTPMCPECAACTCLLPEDLSACNMKIALAPSSTCFLLHSNTAQQWC